MKSDGACRGRRLASHQGAALDAAHGEALLRRRFGTGGHFYSRRSQDGAYAVSTPHATHTDRRIVGSRAACRLRPLPHAESARCGRSKVACQARTTSRPPPGSLPTYPSAMNVLYLLYFCACLCERTWRFGLPLVLAFMEGGYQAIATLGFVSPLACSLLGPAVGRILDRVYRPYGLGSMVALQGVAIAASGLVVLVASANPLLPFTESPWFFVLLLFSMVERLTAIASELAIERDWVTQLSGKNNSLALANSNARLRRTDLCCELVGSLAFGWLYSVAGLTYSVAGATLLAVILAPMQLYCVYWIAKLAPEALVHGREEVAVALFKPSWKMLLDQRHRIRAQPRVPLLQHLRQQVTHALDGWGAYFRQPILPSSLAFVLLFFNVALSPGGLITAFLIAWGLDGTSMAVFRGGCATMGFVGTWVGRRIIQRYGLLQAGKKALLVEAVLLGVATTVYAAFLSGPLPVRAAGSSGGVLPVAVIVFAAAVVLSRVGMWSYDMVNAQLFQQTVSPREVGAASSAEMALCSLSELTMLGLAAYVITPASYSLLVFGSFAAVIAATSLFSWWVPKAPAEEDADLQWAAAA